MHKTHLKVVPPVPESQTEIERRDELVRAHIRLAHHVAVQQQRRYLAYGVDLADLIASGLEGLIQAASRFDESRGVQFSTFAYYRVRGAVIDCIRASIDPYNHPDMDQFVETEYVEDELLDADLHRRLRKAVASLPEPQRDVIVARYFQGRTLAASGEDRGISKSWASRQHSRAITTLRKRLRFAA